MKTTASRTLRLLFLTAGLALLATACNDEETPLGSSVTGSDSRYEGLHYTLHADSGVSQRDDSLMTTGYNAYNTYGIIGNYTDATFGHVSAMLFTQIALPTNANDINFSEMTIDSVVLTLVKRSLYPDTGGTYNFHFEVMQLAEALQSDTLYHDYDTLPVNPEGRFFDDDVSVAPTDTVIRLTLGNGIASVLQQTATSAEFIERTKGLRVRLTDAGDEGMISINFSAVKTCLSVYYHYHSDDTVSTRYPFLLGTGTYRFTHFHHDYNSSVTAGADNIDGANRLYLEPLAGYRVLLSFDNAVRAFAEAHPMATVHHAELLLPVAAMETVMPTRVLAKKNSGTQPYIDDLTDLYVLAGFDGTYDTDRNCYRLRVTQHVQGLLRNKADPGTLLVLDARQNDAARIVLNGISAADPVRIEIVYSE